MGKIIDMSKHFTTKDLLRYAAPSMAMVVFTSIYGIVDGFFISNYAGKTAFAAVNLIMPFIMILGTLGFMMGTGGSALVAQARGQGNNARANSYFSTIIWFSLIAGLLLATAGALLMQPVARALGASSEMLGECVLYGRISMISLAFFILQFAFQPLFATAGKPHLGFAITVASGLTNIVLDWLLVGVLGLEVVGAASATVASELLGGIVPLVYFLCPNSSFLRLGKPRADWRLIGKVCVNGSSEMMASIATSVVSMLYNFQLMAYLGEDGVSAYGVIMYAGMIFGAILQGYCMGTAPLMSYQHGAENSCEKRSLLRHAFAITGVMGVAMFALSQMCAAFVAQLFVGYDQGLCALTVHAFRTYALCLIFVNFSLVGSSTFTALGNGLVSAVISFAHTLVFECGAVLILPSLVGIDGIWYSVFVAEVASTILVVALFAKFGHRYGLRPFLGGNKRKGNDKESIDAQGAANKGAEGSEEGKSLCA